MPTKKQRRRRAKGKRHEYVWEDEFGNEVDPAELKPAKTERQVKAKQAPTAKDRRGRPIKPVKPASWRRSATRAIIFVAALFVFVSLVGKKKPTLAARIGIAAAYGVIGVPFFYWMDRSAYRRYLRATGRENEIEPSSGPRWRRRP